MDHRGVALGLAVLSASCAAVQQRYPDDVQTAFARDPMRRRETEHVIVYYPAPRRAEVDRFLARAERCAGALRQAAVNHTGAWNDKLVIVMPDAPFNNAFVMPPLQGYEAVAVIPTYATLDFTTEFGLVADPGLIACHELTHYVHDQQVTGFWHYANLLLGNQYDPQVGFDAWVFEGLATHYETALNPGVGRPTWPLFTGIFAAGYAGRRFEGGDLNQLNRLAAVGHEYLGGAMFVKFLAAQYGEAALWRTIASQAGGLTGLLSPTSFSHGFGKGLGALLDEFNAWITRTYPVRARPAGQRTLATVGNDARYARGLDGTEAWVADDVDLPTRLVVRDAAGAELAAIGLVDIAPPRRLVEAQPLLVSGLSVTADGREVWLTALDTSATFEVPRLLRWRRGDSGLTEIATDLGPGAAIDPRGETYYYCEVDGDRWSLAAYDVRTGARRRVRDMAPGTYITSARVSPDGTRLVADVFDGQRFVAWELDAKTGATRREIRGDGVTAIFDASFTSDGRLMWLGEIAGRFQVVVEGTPVTDAPYAAFAAREARGTIRFLDREGWEWELAEVAVPPSMASDSALAPVPLPSPLPGVLSPLASDAPFSLLDHLFTPQLHSPTLVIGSGDQAIAGFALGGGDRLGLQRWQLTGFVQPYIPGDHHLHFGGDAQYQNLQLAPLSIFAEASQLDWGESLTAMDGSTVIDAHRTRDALLALARTFRGSITAALSGLYTDDEQRQAGFAPLLRHVAGPQLSLAYTGIEATRYTGVRRALVASAAVAEYPHAASSFASDITDVGGALGVTAPLPLGRRHTLALQLRGRALISRAETGLLQLGGDGLAPLVSSSTAATAPPAYDDSRFPPNLRFVEDLRGYEDYAITTDRAAIADVTYRYPLIIDRGTASLLWILPSVFVRQLDLELFGAGAVDRARDLHAAAGAALSLRFAVWRAPLTIVYQIARRVRDDDALTQLVSLLVE